jgi:hypothetical protein
MEGGLLIHAAYALSLIWVWIYRRWFEPAGPRSVAFERFCADRPLLAAFSVQAGSEERMLAALRAALPNGETLPTLGAWPWIHHVLRVEAEARPGVVLLWIAGCRLLRTREVRPVALTHVLGELTCSHASEIQGSWLCAQARIDVTGRVPAEHGWQLVGDAADKKRFLPWERRPAWAASEPLSQKWRDWPKTRMIGYGHEAVSSARSQLESA